MASRGSDTGRQVSSGYRTVVEDGGKMCGFWLADDVILEGRCHIARTVVEDGGKVLGFG